MQSRKTVGPIRAPQRPRHTPTRDGWAPADPLRRPVLFVNPRSGGGKAVRAALAERAQERGIEVVVLGPDANLEALVAEAVAGGADALGVAGGDGSLALVAAAAHAHELAFVCIPAGTRNHFALDLGVDRHDLVGALDAFTDGGRTPHRRCADGRAPVPEQRLSRDLRRCGAAIRVPRCKSAHVAGHSPSGARSEPHRIGTAPRRRHGPRAPSPSRRTRLQQPLRPGSAVGDRQPADADGRPARHPCPRSTGRSPASPGTSVDRDIR